MKPVIVLLGFGALACLASARPPADTNDKHTLTETDQVKKIDSVGDTEFLESQKLAECKGRGNGGNRRSSSTTTPSTNTENPDAEVLPDSETNQRQQQQRKNKRKQDWRNN